MGLVLDRVATTDNYPQVPGTGASFAPVGGVKQINWSEAGVADFYAQFAVPMPGRPGKFQWEQFEHFYPASTGGAFATNVYGVRFRSAVAGTPATITADLIYVNDPVIITGAPTKTAVVTAGITTGMIVAFGAGVPPTGFLLCDGSAVSRSTYAALFGVLGTTYGAGDGVTTFNVPDLRGRLPVGVSPAGKTQINALAKSDGLAQALRNIFHRHTSPQFGFNVGGSFGSGSSGNTEAAITVSGDTDNTDAPAFLVVQYIIAT